MPLSAHMLRRLSYEQRYLKLGMKDHAAAALAQIREAERMATPVLVPWLAVHSERSA